MQMITYNLTFNTGECGTVNGDIIELAQSQIYPSKINLFPEKVHFILRFIHHEMMTKKKFYLQIPNDLRNCPVRIVTRNWPPFILSPYANDFAARINTDADNVDLNDGIEIRTIKLIAEKLKFKAVFV